DFFRESRKLTEGLAQYYTHETVNKLKPKGGDLRPLEAYKRMLSLQPEAYTHHLEWAAAWHPEVVRSAMIQARNHGNISREKFEDLMATEAKRLKVERGLFRAFPALKKSGNPAPGALSRLDP
ncbi:MAG: hypothetical protein ACE5H3_11310, partial [Planctomycetota bacterium]